MPYEEFQAHMSAKYTEDIFNKGYAIIKKNSEVMFDQSDVEVEEYEKIMQKEIGTLIQDG